jgi:hypothetical protein
MNRLKTILGLSLFLVQGHANAQLAGQLSDDLIKAKAHLHPVLVGQIKSLSARKLSASAQGQVVNRIERLGNGFSLIEAKDSNQLSQKYLLRESDNALIRINSAKVRRPDMVKNHGRLSSTSQAIEILNADKIQPALLMDSDLSVYGLSAAQVLLKVDKIIEPAPKKICISVIVGGSGFVSHRPGPTLTNVMMGGSGFSHKMMSGGFVSGSASNCR